MTESTMVALQELDFCLQEVKLYLDTHPCDVQAFNYWKSLTMEREMRKKKVEAVVGPLTVQNSTSCRYNWVDGPWPWEKEANADVDL